MEASADGTDKAEWRKRMAAARDAVPPAERIRLSGRLCANVEREILMPMRERLNRPLTVCIYSAFRSEADPLPLARTCWSAGDTVAAPRIVGGGLEWRIVQNPSDWHPGSWNVPEPDPSRTIPLPPDRPPDAILVPGLAFHPGGGRLGYGGGYYDRLYAAERARGNDGILWIGFALSIQWVREPLPREPHDLKLDVIATEEQVIWLNREGN